MPITPRTTFAILLAIVTVAALTVGCRGSQPSATPSPTSKPTWAPQTVQPEVTRTSRPRSTATPTAVPTTAGEPAVTALPTPVPSVVSEAMVASTPIPEPTATRESEVTATPSPGVFVVRVQPTLTPRPGDEETNISLLPLGQAGNYVNVTFGYWLQYPVEWHTRFGNRPLLVSLSNLDPGTHNRQSIREQGCLIEINAASNIYGFTFEAVAAQLPRSFPDVQEIDLAGERAWRVRRTNDSASDSEWVYVEHGGRLFTLNIDVSAQARGICLPAWEYMLSTWRWFSPSFAQYVNTPYGYAISYPRSWHQFNVSEQGVFIGSEDPLSADDWVGLMEKGLLVETWVYPNDAGLPLKEWLVAQIPDESGLDLTNDIPLDGMIGVRVLSSGLTDGIEEMSGFFQGPLGRIYMVACNYPVGRKWEYRPIANAIIYSFTFY